MNAITKAVAGVFAFLGLALGLCAVLFMLVMAPYMTWQFAFGDLTFYDYIAAIFNILLVGGGVILIAMGPLYISNELVRWLPGDTQ